MGGNEEWNRKNKKESWDRKEHRKSYVNYVANIKSYSCEYKYALILFMFLNTSCWEK